jgi:FkbM family methyltransferase
MFDIQHGDVIVDVGGNSGLFIPWATWEGACGGISYEPCKNCHGTLAANAKPHGFHVSPFAVGVRSGLTEMLDHGNSPAGALRSCMSSYDTYVVYEGTPNFVFEISLEKAIESWVWLV